MSDQYSPANLRRKQTPVSTPAAAPADVSALSASYANHLVAYEHMTPAVVEDLTDGGATTLHKHDHAAQDNLNSANYTHLTAANHTDLTDAGDTSLHYHSSDRNADNHASGTTNKVYTATEQTKLAGIETGAEVNNISDVNATDLTDGGATTLHKHDHAAQDNMNSATYSHVTENELNSVKSDLWAFAAAHG